MPLRIKVSTKRIRGEPRGGRGRPCRLSIHKKSRHMRRWLLRNPWIRPFVVFSFAASMLQALARGFLVRKEGSLRQYITKRNLKFDENIIRRYSPTTSSYIGQEQGRGLGQLPYPAHIAAAASGSGNANSQRKRQLDKYLVYVAQFEVADGKMLPLQGKSDAAAAAAAAALRGGKAAAAAHVGRGGGGRGRGEPFSALPRTAPVWLSGGYSIWCVVRIQAWYKMSAVRRRYLYKKRVIMQIAALVLQNSFRAACLWQEKQKELMRVIIDPITAVCRIQLAWRSHCNRRIFSYYKDLVTQKLHGAPSDILKVIIPGESSLLDKASGVLARFRLGGHVFPPKVMFKLFTSRGVCDVNAFAPRDYANEKPVEAFQQNIQSHFIPKDSIKYSRNIRVGQTYFDTKITTATSMENWYKRDERNPWRPLVPTNQHDDILTPPWMRDVFVEKPLAPFHFSKLKRKTDQVKLRKKKKREWLRKAYILAGVPLNGQGQGQGQNINNNNGNSNGNSNDRDADGLRGDSEGGSQSQSQSHPVVAIISDRRDRNRARDIANRTWGGGGGGGGGGGTGDYSPPRTYSAGLQEYDNRLNSPTSGKTRDGGRGRDRGRGGGLDIENSDDGESDGSNHPLNGGGKGDDFDGFSESLALLSMSRSMLDNQLPAIAKPGMAAAGQWQPHGNAAREGGGGGGDIHLPTIPSRNNLSQQPSNHPLGQTQQQYQQQQYQQQQHQQQHRDVKQQMMQVAPRAAHLPRGAPPAATAASSIDTDRNEDLLAWSLALDFDDYAATWGNIATSRA